MKRSLVLGIAAALALVSGAASAASDTYLLVQLGDGLGLKVPAVAEQPYIQSVSRLGFQREDVYVNPIQRAFLRYSDTSAEGDFVNHRFHLKIKGHGSGTAGKRPPWV